MHLRTGTTFALLSALLIAAGSATPSIAQSEIAAELKEATAELATTKYRLSYDFKPGEVIRYTVEHLATVDTQISGNKQVAKSTSKSTRALKVVESAGENIRFVNLIEDVNMWQQSNGRAELRYDSTKDNDPPAEFSKVAESIGTPLATLVINRSGQVIKRESGSASPDLGFGSLIIPMPAEEVRLGHSWTVPKKLRPKDKDGRIKEVKTQLRYKLEKVQSGVATISVKTEILTPINDATVQSQLVQQISNGEIKFDIDAGRLISKRLDWTENVVGFNGANSNMKYLARYTETLKKEPRTASKKKSGAG